MDHGTESQGGNDQNYLITTEIGGMAAACRDDHSHESAI